MLLFAPFAKYGVNLFAVVALLLWCPISFTEAMNQTRESAAQTGAIDAVRSTIAKGIALLEAGNSEAFVKELYSPELFKRITQKHTVSEAVQAMTKNGDLARTLRAFKAAATGEPRLVKDGTMAIFEFVQPVDTLKGIAFVRIDTRWYLF
jgi:hypothetical protein